MKSFWLRRWPWRQVLNAPPKLHYALRSVGLETINVLLRPWAGFERPKYAMQRSSWAAISRAAIHIIPVGICIFLVWLNNHTYYLGPGLSMNNSMDTTYLALYQVASKITETSLTVVIFQALRYNLLHNSGIPFGLIGSGLSFTQLSFFWSPEFVLNIKSCLFSRRRLPLFVFIVLSGAIAATIGPSVAVLMLPRIQAYPAARISYYLNSTTHELWPSHLNSSSEEPVCFISNATQYGVCPSGGYASVKNVFSSFFYSDFLACTGAGYAPKLRALGGLNGFSFAIQSQMGLLPVLMSMGQLQDGYWGSGTYAFQPPAIVAALQQSILISWFGSTLGIPNVPLDSESEFKYSGSPLTSTVDSTFPLVRTRCTLTVQNLSAQASSAAFPTLRYNAQNPNGAFDWDENQNASITMLERGFSNNPRAQWVTLPHDIFGPVSTGLLFEMPWVPANGPNSTASRTVSGCSLQAAWYNGTVTTTSDTSYLAWFIQDWTGIGPKGNVTPIDLDRSWLDLLTPPAPDAPTLDAGRPMTTLEMIINATNVANFYNDITNTETPDLWTNDTCAPTPWSGKTEAELWYLDCNHAKTFMLEAIFATVLTDGLSRYGSALTVHTAPNLQGWWVSTFPQVTDFNEALLDGTDAFLPPADLSKVLKLTTYTTLMGYSYYSNSVTDYLAQVVVCLYIFIALCHLAWVAWFRVSSASWDTVVELVALTQNSPPTQTLQGTSAGIHCLSTYKKTVRLRALPVGGEEGGAAGEHIVLQFDDDDTHRPDGQHVDEEADATAIRESETRSSVEEAKNLHSLRQGTSNLISTFAPYLAPIRGSASRASSTALATGAESPFLAGTKTWPLVHDRTARVREIPVAVERRESKGAESGSYEQGRNVEIGKKYD